MNCKEFKTVDILDCLLENMFEEWPEERYEDDEEHLMSNFSHFISEKSEFEYPDDFENVYSLVFKDSDGKHWKFEYEQNEGACYDDLFGTRGPQRPWSPETSSFVAIEVELVEKVIVKHVWHPV